MKSHEKRKNGGSFGGGVDTYLQYMRRKGAMVVVYEGRKKQFWELTAAGTVIPLQKLSRRFSPQTRRLMDDFPDRVSVFASGTAQYGGGNYEILLLIPAALDQQIKAAIETILTKRFNLSDLTAVHLTYRQEDSVFTSFVDWGLVNGKKVALGHLIRL